MALFRHRAERLFHLRREAESGTAGLPALLLRANKLAASVLQGAHNKRRTGIGEKFWQFREYAQQDRPQDIDWRQSAKTERIYIREKERQTPQSAAFWCANYPGMRFASRPGLPEKAEAAQIMTMALASLLIKGGEEVGLYGHSRRGRSEAALERMGQALLESAENQVMPDIGQTIPRRGSACFLIGDFLDPVEKISTCFKSLSENRLTGYVIQILDPAELDLPYDGRVLFESPGGEVVERVENVASLRTAYKKRMQEHLQSLESFCRNNGWDYYLHRTDKPVSESLADIWAVLHHRSQGGALL